MSIKWVGAFVGVWVASIAGAYYVGQSAGERDTALEATGLTREEAREARRNWEEEAARAREQARSEAEAAADEAREALAANTDLVAVNPPTSAGIRAAFAEKDPLKQKLMLAQALDALTPESLPEVLAAFAGRPLDWENWDAWSMLMTAWARFDPPGAVAYAQSNLEGRMGGRLSAMAMRQWAMNNPQAAMAFAQDSENGGRELMFGTLLGMAESSPGQALNAFLNLPGELRSGRGAGFMLRRLAQEDPSGLMRWLGSEAGQGADGQLRADAYEAYVRAIAEDGGEQMLAQLGQFAGDPAAQRAFREAGERLARQDPQAALAMAEDLPEAARQEMLSGLVNEWTEEDPQAVADYLNSLPATGAEDPLVDEFARRAAQQDPVAALEWASTIQDPQRRSRTLVDVGRYLASQNAAAAQEFVASTDQLNDAQKEAILSVSEGERLRPPWAGGGG